MKTHLITRKTTEIQNSNHARKKQSQEKRVKYPIHILLATPKKKKKKKQTNFKIHQTTLFYHKHRPQISFPIILYSSDFSANKQSKNSQPPNRRGANN